MWPFRSCRLSSWLLYCTLAWCTLHCSRVVCVVHAMHKHPPSCRCCCHLIRSYGTQPDRGPAHVDVFRDFGPESTAGGTGKGPMRPQAGPSATATASAGGAAANAPKLSDLFKPPAGLLFLGGWPAAVAEAGRQGKWLLVNIQNSDEFATHRLNRDTWGDALVQDMLKGSFIFWQVRQQRGSIVVVGIWPYSAKCFQGWHNRVRQFESMQKPRKC